MSLKSLYKNSSWRESLGTAPALYLNDAGAELAKRDAYQSEAEADCKSQHKNAYPFRGMGRAGAPYRNCVSAKMGQYDSSVGAEQAAAKKAAEDARLALLEMQHTANVQAQAGAVTQVETAKAASIDAQTSASTQQYLAIAGIILIIGGGIFVYKKYLESKTASAV